MITRTKRPRIEKPIYPTSIIIKGTFHSGWGGASGRHVCRISGTQPPPPPHPHPVCADKIKNRKEQHQQKQLKLARLVLLLLYPTRCLRNIFFTGQGNINIVKPYILTNEYPAYLEC